MDLQPQLATFNDILDLYAVSDENINRQELFETFSQFANEAHGLCIPLAISMFGNWLLTFNRDSALESNYQNDLILDYFRKSIRLALVIRRLAPFFDAHLQQLSKKDRLDVTRYWKKDNTNALSTSLHSLGEYHQFIHEHDKAVTIWEINCHLTEDAELGNLAVLGLTNGYGFGNLAKKQNRFGHHSKKHRYNTKRRIAHIYRILMKKPGFDEFGVSWLPKRSTTEQSKIFMYRKSYLYICISIRNNYSKTEPIFRRSLQISMFSNLKNRSTIDVDHRRNRQTEYVSLFGIKSGDNYTIPLTISIIHSILVLTQQEHRPSSSSSRRSAPP